MTPSRIAALVAIVLGVFALAFVGLRGGESERYTLIFEDAGGLIPGNLLRVNGITMGTVSSIGITDDLKAKVDVEVNELGPLRQGTLAQIRATSLGGVANKYIALSLAPNNAPRLPDGAVLNTDVTRGITGQDELVNAFDEETRAGLQKFVKGSAASVEGNSENIKKAIENAPGTLSELSRFAEDLQPDETALRELLVNGAAIDTALANKTEAITRLTANAGVASSAFAGNGSEIAETLAGAPDTVDEATAVLTELPDTLDEVERLVTELDRNKEGFPETLAKLTETLDDGESTIASLARALNKPGDDNDAADLLEAAPAVGRAASGAAQSVPGGLADATPLLSDLRAYTPDVVAAVTGLGLISANYDAAGHYARLSPVFNILQQSAGSDGSQDLIPRSSLDNRLNGFQTAKNRCPGAAAQATTDGSAPFTDGGAISCTSSEVLPGP